MILVVCISVHFLPSPLVTSYGLRLQKMTESESVGFNYMHDAWRVVELGFLRLYYNVWRNWLVLYQMHTEQHKSVHVSAYHLWLSLFTVFLGHTRYTATAGYYCCTPTAGVYVFAYELGMNGIQRATYSWGRGNTRGMCTQVLRERYNTIDRVLHCCYRPGIALLLTCLCSVWCYRTAVLCRLLYVV